MSWEAVKWALDDAPMLRTEAGKPDTTARAVLVARAERAGVNGENSHAAVEDVVWRTGYDDRTVQRAQERLEGAGLMVRDGVTDFGTIRWNLNMTLKRPDEERDEIRADILRRRADHAKREQIRRDRLREARGPRADSASARVDLKYARGDGDSARADAVPPEPPTNHPGTILESPTGGTLPPDPLGPEDLPSSDLRRELESDINMGGNQSQDLIGELRPRARGSGGQLAEDAGSDSEVSTAMPRPPGERPVGRPDRPVARRTTRKRSPCGYDSCVDGVIVLGDIERNPCQSCRPAEYYEWRGQKT